MYKKQDIVQQGVQFAGVLNAGYELNYTINANNSQQIANIADASYRVDRGANGTYQLGKQSGDELSNKAEDYGYDANGNLIYVLKGTRKPDSTLIATNSRKLLWDSLSRYQSGKENRLLGINDNGFVSNYWYDAAGERTVKMSGDGEGVNINGVVSAGRTGTTNFTAYISPYLVVRNGGEYTKHIYMGGQRITSKVSNSGIFGTSPVKDTLQAKYATQTATLKSRYDSLGVSYKGVTKSGSLISNAPTTASSSYFYHSDHLGSSSLITDLNGEIVQHVEYVPFGETFIDERRSASSWTTPYLFNGKERDEETGLHYYHARYYDSRTSVWLSVDPLAEKYFWTSSYVYCKNNPVNRIDPDGRTDFEVNGERKTIDDGNRGVTVEASERQYNKALNKFNDGKGYEKYLIKLCRNNVVTTTDLDYITNKDNQIIGYDFTITKHNTRGSSVDWDAAVQNADDWMIAASMADAQLPFGDIAGLLRVGATRLGKLLFGGAKGFNSFSAFKRAMGPAGPGQAWHHIVEQTSGNIAQFGNQAIHNIENLMKLPHGAGSIHAKISGYYSSIQPFTGGQTVRQWLSTQSFQAQYDFGIQTLKNFGW